MEDIFNPNECAALLTRVAKVRGDQKPVWGKMSAAQMFLHCQFPVEVALGEMRLKRGLIGFLFGGIAKRKLLGSEQYGRNLPTAPEFIVRDARDAEKERKKLEALVTRLSRGGPAALIKGPHPFFGPLTPEQWSRLQWKHLDHHLRQFGA